MVGFCSGQLGDRFRLGRRSAAAAALKTTRALAMFPGGGSTTGAADRRLAQAFADVASVGILQRRSTEEATTLTVLPTSASLSAESHRRMRQDLARGARSRLVATQMRRGVVTPSSAHGWAKWLRPVARRPHWRRHHHLRTGHHHQVSDAHAGHALVFGHLLRLLPASPSYAVPTVARALHAADRLLLANVQASRTRDSC